MADFKWCIKYFYTDADSFNSWESDGELPMLWTDLDKAKAALKRIRDVWIFEEKLRQSYGLQDTNVYDKLIELTGSKEFPTVCIEVELDDGTMQSCSTPWRGYFSRLKSVRIEKVVEQPEDNDMSFSPEDLPWDYFRDDK